MPSFDAKIDVIHEPDGSCRLDLSGDWLLTLSLPDMHQIEASMLEGGDIKRVSLNGEGIQEWNTGLLVFVTSCMDWCQSRDIPCITEGLPHGPQQLLKLSLAAPEKQGTHLEEENPTFFKTIGSQTLDFYHATLEIFHFLGECVLGFIRLIRGKAKLPWQDLALIIQQCGAEALPIVALISFLVGLILAFVGGVQLAYFGATIYTADLVGIAMTREMAGLMTAIIMCGRTGAAFAAQLGSMKVSEEMDAFRTFGISPIDYLVLPRMIALIIMIPLLCVFADFVGIFGGLVVGMSVLDLGFTQYINQTLAAIRPIDFVFGVFKGACFGSLVAASGCLRGMQCGDNSAAVGYAATSAVVTGITAVIIADALFAVMANIMGI